MVVLGKVASRLPITRLCSYYNLAYYLVPFLLLVILVFSCMLCLLQFRALTPAPFQLVSTDKDQLLWDLNGILMCSTRLLNIYEYTTKFYPNCVSQNHYNSVFLTKTNISAQNWNCERLKWGSRVCITVRSDISKQFFTLVIDMANVWILLGFFWQPWTQIYFTVM